MPRSKVHLDVTKYECGDFGVAIVGSGVEKLLGKDRGVDLLQEIAEALGISAIVAPESLPHGQAKAEPEQVQCYSCAFATECAFVVTPSPSGTPFLIKATGCHEGLEIILVDPNVPRQCDYYNVKP